MGKYSVVRASTLAVVVAVAHASTFTWQGPDSSFTNSANWNGASPFQTGGAPAVNIGSSATTVVSTVGDIGATTLGVGRGIMFGGATTLNFDTSAGAVTMNFDGSAQGTASTFLPGSSASPGRAYDYNCDQNWLVSGGVSSLGIPCVGDFIQFPTGSNFWLFASGTAVNSGAVTTTGTVVPNCTSADNTVRGPNFMIQMTTCTDFQVVTGGTSGGLCSFGSCSTTTTTTTTTSTTISTVTLPPVPQGQTNAPISASPTYVPTSRAPTSLPPTSRAPVTAAPTTRAPTATSHPPHMPLTHAPTSLAPVTHAPTTHAPTTHAPTIKATQPPTVAPTQTAASTGGGGAGGGSILIIIIVILVVLIAAVIGFVVFKKQGSSGGVSDDRTGAAFANPLYDDQAGSSSTDPDNNALYADADEGGYMDVPVGGEEDGGYMDVPLPGGDEEGGYMDVPVGGDDETGYMDTAPVDGADDV